MTYEDVEFAAAKPGQAAYVYVCPKGWEYGWVTDVDYFTDEAVDPLTVTRQRWVLMSEDQVVFHPADELCPHCHGEEVEPCPIDTDGDGNCASCARNPEFHGRCRFCKGDGGHPLAGQMEVL